MFTVCVFPPWHRHFLNFGSMSPGFDYYHRTCNIKASLTSDQCRITQAAWHVTVCPFLLLIHSESFLLHTHDTTHALYRVKWFAHITLLHTHPDFHTLSLYCTPFHTLQFQTHSVAANPARGAGRLFYKLIFTDVSVYKKSEYKNQTDTTLELKVCTQEKVRVWGLEYNKGIVVFHLLSHSHSKHFCSFTILKTVKDGRYEGPSI